MSPTSYQAALPRDNGVIIPKRPRCQRFLKAGADEAIISSQFLRQTNPPKENEIEDLHRRPASLGQKLAVLRPDGLPTGSASAKGTDPVAVVKVPDPRLERLAAIFDPKKKTAAAIEFVELQGLAAGEAGKTSFSEQFLGKLRTADALLAVVRSFRDPAVPHPLDRSTPGGTWRRSRRSSS